MVLSMSSSAPVRATRSSRPERTVSGSPMTWEAVQPLMASRSKGVKLYSSASSGLGYRPGLPWRRRRKARWPGAARRWASASLVGADGVDAEHHVRRLEHLRGSEGRAVDLQGGIGVAGGEVVGEREGQAELAGQVGAVVARPEQPEGGLVAAGRGGLDRRVGVPLREAAGEVGDQLGQELGEVLAVRALGAAAEGVGGGRVRARGAADAQVDAAGGERLQHPELLGDDQRGVVGQHHTAGAEADGRRLARHPGQEHGGRRRGDARHRVVLGDPVAPVAEALDLPGEAQGAGQRVGGRGARAHRGQVEDGQGELAHRGIEREPRPGSSAIER